MDLFKNFIKNYYSDLNRICENIERNSFEKLYFKIKNFKKKKITKF